MKLILLIHVKMPTNVGILTIISWINTTYYESYKARNFTARYFSAFKFLLAVEISCSIELSMKKEFYILMARFSCDMPQCCYCKMLFLFHFFCSFLEQLLFSCNHSRLNCDLFSCCVIFSCFCCRLLAFFQN